MIPLNVLLKLKFGDINFLQDVRLQDDGNGVYIQQWNLTDQKQPSDEEIAAWQKDEDLNSQFSDSEASEKRAAAYPPITDLIVALWEKTVLNDDTKAVELQTQREAVQAEFPKSTGE